MTHKEWTAILAWPGYRVYRHELDEEAKTLKLWEQLSEMSGLRNWVPQGANPGLNFGFEYTAEPKID